MEGLSSVTSVPEELTAAVAACFGTQLVSEALSSELRQSLPFATFARVSIRCGSGLFVTDDLLQPGPILLTMVSLQSSMAGLAMREGKPVALAVSPGMGDKWQSAGDGPPTTSVVCYPVGVERHYDGLCQSYIGAVQLGLAEPLSDRAHAELEELCRCLGPYLLLVSLTKVQDMSKLMSLPGTECVCCTGEEEEPEEDAPFGRCLDDLGPGGPPGGSAPPQTAANLAGPATASHQQQQQQQQEEQYEDEQQRQGRQQQQQALKEAQQQELQGIGVVRGSLEAPSTPLASSSQRTLPSLEQQQPAKEEEEGPETGPAATAAAALAQAERLLIEQQWVEPGQAGAEEVPWAAMEAAVAAVPAADERPAPPAAAVAAEQAAGLAAVAAGALYESAAGQPAAAAVAADAARMAAAAAAGAYESPKKPSAGTEGLRYRSKGVLSEPGTSSGEFEASPFVTGKGGKGSLPHHKHQQQQKFAELEPCGSTSSEGYAEEEDLKAAAKRARSALSAATLRQGLLLTFRDPAVETRFRQEQAQDLCKMDLLFHLVYLVAFACTAAMDPPGVLGVATNIWLAWVLALPAVTIVTCTEWVARRYVRWRSWLLIPVTLLHMLHYRFAAAPALLQVLPTTALRKLPWLLRCTGAEALLVFPLGSKMPFSVFLPTQLASMLLMLTLLPGPCEALLPLLACNPGCLPAGWGVRSGAALLGAGFLLPTCAVYFGEHRARRHFASTVQAMQA